MLILNTVIFRYDFKDSVRAVSVNSILFTHPAIGECVDDLELRLCLLFFQLSDELGESRMVSSQATGEA